MTVRQTESQIPRNLTERIWLLGLDSPPLATSGAGCGVTGDSP
jgi:hypothetical protein